MKVCNKCNRNLDDSAFSKSSGANYLRPECKECNNKLARERKELRKEYGYPNSDYTCPICGRGESQLIGTGGNASTWVVDHDHKTNSFRGFLCHGCNRAIGMLQDDVKMLQNAIDYLNKNCYTGITEADAHFLERVRSGIHKTLYRKSYRKS